MASVPRRLGRVIFVRHGESIWNVNDANRNLTKRFTGWTDIPLTDRGRAQAVAAGEALRKHDISFDAVYTSLLQRARDSYTELAKGYGGDIDRHVSVISSWRLNERHYGSLGGFSKKTAHEELKVEKDRMMSWRKSWDEAPPALKSGELRRWNSVDWAQPVTIMYHPGQSSVIISEKGVQVPNTESLRDCAVRALPLWKLSIVPRILNGESILVVAHANTIRAMIRHIDTDTMSTLQLAQLSIPSATPLVYDFHVPVVAAKGKVSLSDSGADVCVFAQIQDMTGNTGDISTNLQDPSISPPSSSMPDTKSKNKVIAKAQSNIIIESMGTPDDLGMTGRFLPVDYV